MTFYNDVEVAAGDPVTATVWNKAISSLDEFDKNFDFPSVYFDVGMLRQTVDISVDFFGAFVRYWDFGNLCFVYGSITANGTGTANTDITIGLPRATSASIGANYAIGSFSLSSGGQFYTGTVLRDFSSAQRARLQENTTGFLFTSPTGQITTGDELHYQLAYYITPT